MEEMETTAKINTKKLWRLYGCHFCIIMILSGALLFDIKKLGYIKIQNVPPHTLSATGSITEMHSSCIANREEEYKYYLEQKYTMPFTLMTIGSSWICYQLLSTDKEVKITACA